jgi:hypothetical protein
VEGTYVALNNHLFTSQIVPLAIIELLTTTTVNVVVLISLELMKEFQFGSAFVIFTEGGDIIDTCTETISNATLVSTI